MCFRLFVHLGLYRISAPSGLFLSDALGLIYDGFECLQTRRSMAPIWRDVYAENYYKALNRRAVTLKQANLRDQQRRVAERPNETPM
jgi:hypothetical protein